MANELLNLRSITNPRKAIGDYLKLPWYFDKPYEKIVLIIMAFWSVYAVYKIFWVGC